jgi:hypothetical protein
MLGLSRTQLTTPGAAGTGSIAISEVASPGAVNLTTEGVLDWFAVTDFTDYVSTNRDYVYWHWKQIGGQRMLQSFTQFVQAAWQTVGQALGVMPTSFSANANDDGSMDNGNGVPGPVWPLTAWNDCLQWNWQNFLTIHDGWGFSFVASSINTQPRKLRIYLGASSLDLDIIARLEDGTAGDVTHTFSVHLGAGIYAYKIIEIDFKPGVPGTGLIVNVKARNTSDPTIAQSSIRFQGATLA